MKKPSNPNLIPRGGYSCTFPETGYTVSETHPSLYLQMCHKHMQDNGIAIVGGWQDEMWDRACNQNPEIECEDSENPARVVESADIWRFLTTLWEAMEKGAKAVSEEEASRRAEICVTCPKLTHTSCSFGCGKLSEVISTLTLGRSFKNHSELHKASCGVCGCETSSLINWPLDVLQAVDEKLGFVKEGYPSHCWKIEGR